MNNGNMLFMANTHDITAHVDSGEEKPSYHASILSSFRSALSVRMEKLATRILSDCQAKLES